MVDWLFLVPPNVDRKLLLVLLSERSSWRDKWDLYLGG